MRLPHVYIENSEFEGAKNVACVQPLSCDVHFSLISNHSPVGTCRVMKILVLRQRAAILRRPLYRRSQTAIMVQSMDVL